MMRKREEILEQLRELESRIDSLDDISRALVICIFITLIPIALIYILLSI